MTYLVDANVLSEATKPKPNPKVLEWLIANESEIAIDPITLGEIRFGIDVLPRGKRRQSLEHWFDEGIARINCLAFEADTAIRWAQLLAKLRSSGTSMPLKDSLIAATALLHELTVATRNIRHFKAAGVKVVDPFV